MMPTFYKAGNCYKCQCLADNLYKTDRGDLCWQCVEELEVLVLGEIWGGFDPNERDYSEAELEQDKVRVEELTKTHQISFLESEVARLKEVITKRNRQLRALRLPR